MMRLKKITTNLSTIVHLLVEPITSLKKKASLEESIYIIKITLKVTSCKPVISTPLFRFFLFGNILTSNRY